APAAASPAELDARFPTSVAPWHLHVNICLPGKSFASLRGADLSRFGPQGSIATAEACAAADGAFHPHVFGWMLHLYPFA
ncbi:MAG: hypothetical protein ACRDHL_02980, partial [Candidatus Promineifilaceae bacterium]